MDWCPRWAVGVQSSAGNAHGGAKKSEMFQFSADRVLEHLFAGFGRPLRWFETPSTRHVDPIELAPAAF
eukprot:scaffold762_cov363-Pavlova_lutheri.AAC.3